MAAGRANLYPMSIRMVTVAALLAAGCGGSLVTGDASAPVDGGATFDLAVGATCAKQCKGCCQGDVCLPGNDLPWCGIGGAACTQCSTACSVDGGVCLGCHPGDTLPDKTCPQCGHQSVTCGTDGKLVYGACVGQGCVPGTGQTVSCGNCGRGSQAQTCGMDCQWHDSGGCNNQPCSPGSTMAGSCPNWSGSCTGTYTCDNNCNMVFSHCDGPSFCCMSANDGALCNTCKTCYLGNCINGC
jgi:hypothetical protein